ncbi:hypothetical protein E2C01_098676 [Portunus trituberculatus]|uniref:Uncharacterized protein n=1 Tax=Portunus trituberculatus TaxID=210409 RepID=A0A5B7KDH6_PORTR|nr:hypothetical protein [Portunus trituberculatus]
MVLVRFPGLHLTRPSRLKKRNQESRVVHLHHRKPSCAWVKPHLLLRLLRSRRALVIAVSSSPFALAV